MDEEITFQEVKSNLTSQDSKIMHDIAVVYQQGSLDDPKQAYAFCGLLALICEGKVQGFFDETTGLVKWSLTNEYSKKIEEMKLALLQQAQQSPNVVRGPW